MLYHTDHALLTQTITDWRLKKFGKDWHKIASKFAEEAGEVCGAINKMTEETPRATHKDLIEEIGDVLIICYAIAGRLNLTPDEIVAERFYGDVQHRKDK